MPIEKWSDDVVVVHLADDPQFTDDLESMDDRLTQAQGPHRFHAVLDFAAVQYVNSSNIAKLLKLRKQMITADSRLVLCGLHTQVWGAFLVTGLDKVFQFSDNVPTALATIQMA